MSPDRVPDTLETSPGTGRLDLAPGLLLLVLSVVAFLPALDGELLYDDARFVRDNPEVASATRPWRFFLDPTTVDPLGGHGGIYRPLRTLSFAVDRTLHGGGMPSLRWLHATSLLLHGVATVLLFLLLRVLVARPIAFLATLLFCVHPVHAESVAWISSRDVPLSAVLALLALVVEARWGRGRRWIAVVCFLLALLAREAVVVLPAVIFLLRLSRGEKSVKMALLASIPYGIVAAGYVVLRLVLLGSGFSQRGPWAGSVVLSFATQVVGAGHSLLRIVVPLYPRAFAFDHQVGQVVSLLDPRFLVSALVLLGLGAAGLLSLRRRGPLALLLLWYPLFLLPFLNPLLPLNIIASDRFLYLPAAGPIALVVWQLHERVSGATGRRVVRCALGGASLGLLVLSLSVSTLYRDPVSFWEAAAEADPASFRAHHGLGCALYEKGRKAEAEVELRAAVTLEPDYPPGLVDLARVELLSGNVDAGLASFARAVEAWERRGEVAGNAAYAMVCVYLAEHLGGRGDATLAEVYAEKARESRLR